MTRRTDSEKRINPFLHSNLYLGGEIVIDDLSVELVETNALWPKDKISLRFRGLPPKFRKFLRNCHPVFLEALSKLDESDIYRFVKSIESNKSMDYFNFVTEHNSPVVRNRSINGNKKTPVGQERPLSRIRTQYVNGSEVLVVDMPGYPPAICDVDLRHLVEGRHWFAVHVEESDFGDQTAIWIRRERGMPVSKLNVASAIPHPVTTRPDPVDPDSPESVYLAVLALGLQDKKWGDIRSIKHLNGDQFDCRRSNLVMLDEWNQRSLLYEYIQSNPKCKKQRARFHKWFYYPKNNKRKTEPDPFDGSEFCYVTDSVEIFVESQHTLHNKIEESISNDIASLMLKIDANTKNGRGVNPTTVRKYAEIFYLAELSVSFLEEKEAERLLARFDAVEERLASVGLDDSDDDL